jgi:hypothetical protein
VRLYSSDRSRSVKTRTTEFFFSVDATTPVSTVTEDIKRSRLLDELWRRRVVDVVFSVTDMMRTSAGATESHRATETTYSACLSVSISIFVIPPSCTLKLTMKEHPSHLSQDKSPSLADENPAEQ